MRGWRQLARWGFLGALLSNGGFSGCGASPSVARRGGALAVEVAPPVAPPGGLQAELVLPLPELTWQKLRALRGSSAAFLPPSLAGMAAVLLGLPLPAALEVAGLEPARALLVSREGGALGWALALRLRSEGGFLSALRGGSGGPSGWTTEAGLSGGARLRHQGEPEVWALGVLGGHLLVGSNATILADAGSYLVRPGGAGPAASTASGGSSPPTKTEGDEAPVGLPSGDLLLELPRAAFLDGGAVRGVLAPWLSGLSPPPGAEPNLFGRLFDVPTLAARLPSLLVDAQGAHLRLELRPEQVVAELVVEPTSAAGPLGRALESLPVGALRSLLEQPRSAVLALAQVRGPEATSPPSARELAAPFDWALSREEAARLDAALAGAWDPAVPRWGLGLLRGEEGLGLWVGLGEPEGPLLASPTLHLTRRSSKPAPLRKRSPSLRETAGGAAELELRLEARGRGLRALVTTGGEGATLWPQRAKEPTLAAEPRLLRALGQVGAEVHAVLWADLPRLRELAPPMLEGTLPVAATSALLVLGRLAPRPDGARPLLLRFALGLEASPLAGTRPPSEPPQPEPRRP